LLPYQKLDKKRKKNAFSTIFVIFSLLQCLFYTTIASADALVQSQATKAATIIEFFITDKGVRAELEIGETSVASFKNLLPDPIYQKFGFGDLPLRERLAIFYTQDLALLTKNKQPLQGELLSMQPSTRILRDPINGTPLSNQDAAPEIIKVTLMYHFEEGTLPKELVFISPPVRDIGFVVYHNNVAVNDFRYLGSGYQLNLDWEDPWYSRFSSRSLRRQYFSPMSGFIYVEPFEVRKEIIARPRDLQRWVDLGLEGKKIISVDMQGQIKEKVAAFLSDHHPVIIDGKPTKGILDSINFIQRTLTSSRVIDPPQPVNVDAAIIGAIFVYPRSGLPQRVKMDWDLWDDRIQKIPVSAVDQAGPLPTFLDPSWRTLEWNNYLKNPIVPTLNEVALPASAWQILLRNMLPFIGTALFLSLLWFGVKAKNKQSFIAPFSVVVLLLVTGASVALLGRANKPAQQQAHMIVGDLLHNIYRAFDYHDENEIYDVLAQSVDGALLTDIFLETKHSLVLANQGGARAKVKDVVLEALTLKSAKQKDGFTAEATWTVQGSVGHWGHIHQRSNRYQALLNIRVSEQQWKLQKMTVIQEERL